MEVLNLLVFVSNLVLLDISLIVVSIYNFGIYLFWLADVSVTLFGLSRCLRVDSYVDVGLLFFLLCDSVFLDLLCGFFGLQILAILSLDDVNQTPDVVSLHAR